MPSSENSKELDVLLKAHLVPEHTLDVLLALLKAHNEMRSGYVIMDELLAEMLTIMNDMEEHPPNEWAFDRIKQKLRTCRYITKIAAQSVETVNQRVDENRKKHF